MVTFTGRWRFADGVRRPRPNVLIGGSPWRAMRLSERGAIQLDELLDGVEHHELAAMLSTRRVIVARCEPIERVNDVSVVIPTIGDGANLLELTANIPMSCWVIVVNDGEHEIVARDDRTTVLHTKSPYSGPASARNVGLREVGTPFVAFIDDDVRVPDDWVVRLRALCEIPGVMIAAGRIVSAQGSGPAGFLERYACALDMGEHSGPIGRGRTISYVPSAGFMARTEILGEGFDETLTVGEDVDLIWRTNAIAAYDASLVATHAPRATMRQVLRRRFEYGTSAAVLDARHPGSLTHLVLSDWTALPWLGLTLFGVPGAAVGFAASLIQGPRALPNFPASVAVETMARGQLHAAKATSRAALRPYWPITLTAAAVSRRFRRRVLPAIALGYVLAGGNPATVVDDIAYGTGVWAGCVQQRNLRPLLPKLRWSR